MTDDFNTLTANTLALMAILDRTIEEGECLIWQGATGESGHPIYRPIGCGPCTLVRRDVFRLAGGELAARVPIDTTCGERRCLNAAHLISSTVTKIARKAAKQGAWSALPRVVKMAATKQKAGKLTMDAAREIRQSGESCPVLALRYGVGKSLIGRIKRGVAWKDYSNPWAGLGGRSA